MLSTLTYYIMLFNLKIDAAFFTFCQLIIMLLNSALFLYHSAARLLYVAAAATIALSEKR